VFQPFKFANGHVGVTVGIALADISFVVGHYLVDFVVETDSNVNVEIGYRRSVYFLNCGSCSFHFNQSSNGVPATTSSVRAGTKGARVAAEGRND
jgi:hypothetical protein